MVFGLKNISLLDSIDYSLPDNKFWATTKLKAFEDNKFIFAKMLITLFDRVENIAGKGENAGYQHFLLFPKCFQKAYFTGPLKVRIVWQGGKDPTECLVHLIYTVFIRSLAT